MDVAVICSDPDQRCAQRRGRDCIDDAASLLRGRVRRSCFIKIRRHARVFAREVWTNLCPTLAAVHGLEQELVAEVERVWIGLREDERERPGVTRRRGRG